MDHARRMARLSARIFGNVVRKTTKQDHKVVRMFAKRPFQYNLPRYYPPIQEMDSLVKRLRHKGLYRDEHLDFNEMMAEQRTARGKGKPRKGEGKRQQKKKK